MNRWIFLVVLGTLPACASSPTPAARAAVSSEGEEQAACVARFNTKAEIDACRNEVRTNHGRAPR
jgi:hypothetical protein